MNCKHCKAEWTPPANLSLTNCPFCQKPMIEISYVGDKSKPDRILLEVTQRFGVSILGEKRLSPFLKDLMPHVDKKYQKIFTQAVADGVGSRLLELEAEDAAIRAIKIHTIKDGFRKNNGFDQTAEYVVDCFLFSLGWLDKVEEMDTAINESSTYIIKSQLDEAMSNGCLSSDETALLFSLGSKLKLTDDAIATIIIDALKQKGFIPARAIDKTSKNPKEMLCEWLSDAYAKDREASDACHSVDLSDRDDMFDEAARLIVRHQQGSTSLIQRKLKLGYNRSGRLIDQLETAGIVGPFEGSKAREVLVKDEYVLEQLLNELN